VTTNYDTLLEEAARTLAPTKTFRVIRKTDECSSIRSPILIKAHGCITMGDTVVITTNDFVKQLSRETILDSALKLLYATSDLVLLGFGARDIDFLLKLHQIQVDLAQSARPIVAVMNDNNSFVARVLGNRISVLNMELHDFLRALDHQLTSPAAVVADDQGLRVGSVAINFGIVGGVGFRSLVDGRRNLGVRMNWKPNAKKFKLKPQLSKYFGNVARRLRKAALAQGQNLHNNGDLVRLMRFTSTKKGTNVNLRVEPTDYSTFMATNLSVDKVMWPVGKAGKNVSLAQYCGKGLLKLDNPCMANALNVIAMIVTTDGFTFLPRRSSAVSYVGT
jgi:hypothetical protein